MIKWTLIIQGTYWGDQTNKHWCLAAKYHTVTSNVSSSKQQGALQAVTPRPEKSFLWFG